MARVNNSERVARNRVLEKEKDSNFVCPVSPYVLSVVPIETASERAQAIRYMKKVACRLWQENSTLVT